MIPFERCVPLVHPHHIALNLILRTRNITLTCIKFTNFTVKFLPIYIISYFIQKQFLLQPVGFNFKEVQMKEIISDLASKYYMYC